MNFDLAIYFPAMQGKVEEFTQLIDAYPQQAIESGVAGHLSICNSTVQVGMLNQLINIGLDVNKHDSNDIQLIHKAAFSGSDLVLKVLIDAGAELNHQNYAGETALMISSISDAKCFSLLLDAGADWTLTNKNGQSVEDMMNDRNRDVFMGHLAKQQNAAISQGLKDSWAPDTNDGKHLLEKLAGSAPTLEQEPQRARRKM